MVTPAVREAMGAAYEAAMEEAGTGSHQRRCAIMEGHVDKARPSLRVQRVQRLCVAHAAHAQR